MVFIMNIDLNISLGIVLTAAHCEFTWLLQMNVEEIL
jgi:hypothetical protein